MLFVSFQGCKKQAKCGCGKDVIHTLTDAQVTIQAADTSFNSIVFRPVYSNGSTYYFCNPGHWKDSLKKMNLQQYVLISGKAYYDCNYLMQSANYPYLPPVYQVEVTGLREDNYGK